MPKARRKPHKPAVPPAWVETDAQMAGTTVELIERPGREPEVKRMRYHLLEHMAKSHRAANNKGPWHPAQITERQRNAGLALHEAWCETMCSPAQTHVFVDKSVDWDGIAIASAERIATFADVSKFLPAKHRDVVLTVVIHQIPVEDLSGLRAGLDAVADGLRL